MTVTRSNQWLPCLIALALVSVAIPAFDHSEQGVAIDFWGGFFHPIFGPDHVIAMVAVGLWGAFLGAPAIWLLPVVFPLVMAFGGALGVVGVPLPGVETGIAVSAIMLGAMVAFAAKPPLWIAAALVGAFAIFHGPAHGAELPLGADAIAYSMGFVIATGTSHLCGIAFGGLSRWPAGRIAVGAVGAAISLIGFSVDSYERTFAYCAQSLPGRCRDAVDGMPCRHVPGIASLDGSVRSIAILLAGAPPLKTVTGITASLLPAGYEAAFQLEETTHASKQEVYA